jgi:hypothetical protein
MVDNSSAAPEFQWPGRCEDVSHHICVYGFGGIGCVPRNSGPTAHRNTSAPSITPNSTDRMLQQLLRRMSRKGTHRPAALARQGRRESGCRRMERRHNPAVLIECDPLADVGLSGLR